MKPHSSRSRNIAVAATVGALLMLAACGGGSSDESPSSTTAVRVKNAPLNECTSIMAGSRPSDTPEVRERMRQAQQECVERMRANRSTTTTLKKK